ncbi:conserved hypothetical protein [Candidatus Desulfosporosinus infrequens]|uniref:Uncharacterized protein n=1 Tax=Candidatus Desulfosporosinus infrequens TaxID=2043169 RepID=A0A2U3LLR1_9FIRM|nr:conserved hypothetical protein [Candidatus Desulfosporosinus infrequens]
MWDVEIKLGDLIFEKGTDFISDAIEDISRSAYSHTAGLVKEHELIEANGFKKIGYQALDYYAGRIDVYTCNDLTDEQRKAIVDYVIKEVGGHYDYVLFAWEFIRYMFHCMLPYQEGKTVRICSTLWADAYRQVGMDLCPGVKYPSPGDLAISKLLRKVGSL